MLNTVKANRYLILLAPFIFVCHFLEEAPGFVSWFNQHVERDITPGLFWSVNISALIIMLIVVLVQLTLPSIFSDILLVFWFSFLLLANAIFHITGAVLDKAYVPGLITAIALYLPYYFLMMRSIVQSRRIKVFFIIVIAALGALPMMIHGYRILFLGGRLF